MGGEYATNCHCVFHEEVETFCPLECIACVLEYVDSLAVIGLQVERDNTVLLNCVLSLYEMVSSIHQVYGLPLVVLPSNGIICKAVFTNNAAVLSRICDIICSYKNAFLSVRSQKENFSPAELNIRSKSLQQVSRLNTFILCISNMLWRYRSFSSADGKMLFPHLDHQQLQSLGIEESGHSFSIHQHVALLGFVWYFLDQTQPEGSHVHPSAIKHNRDTYMEFLEQEQVSGILNFIRTFIRRKSAK